VDVREGSWRARRRWSPTATVTAVEWSANEEVALGGWCGDDGSSDCMAGSQWASTFAPLPEPRSSVGERLLGCHARLSLIGHPGWRDKLVWTRWLYVTTIARRVGEVWDIGEGCVAFHDVRRMPLPRLVAACSPWRSAVVYVGFGQVRLQAADIVVLETRGVERIEVVRLSSDSLEKAARRQ
jgi:hypothetical protein